MPANSNGGENGDDGAGQESKRHSGSEKGRFDIESFESVRFAELLIVVGRARFVGSRKCFPFVGLTFERTSNEAEF
jgi:hypothetical protein